MKEYLKKSGLFVLPFLIYMVLIAIVDPFNYLDDASLVSSKEKEEIALQVEPHLYKINHFYNDPKSNIILGDSRSNGLFHAMDNPNWGNLAYGGGSLKEIVQSFWWASQVTKLDTVLVGVNLTLYNKYNKRFWVEETLSRRGNFFSYAFNSYTFKSTFQFLNYQQTEDVPQKNKITVSKEEYWKGRLNASDKFFEKIDYPDEYYQDLKEISEYCLKNDIKLIFWIPPTHVDYQKKVKEFDLKAYENRFINDLWSLADVLYFDFNSHLTRDKDNFTDPVHFTWEIGRLIYKEITTYSGDLARVYDHDDLNKLSIKKNRKFDPLSPSI